MARTPRRLLAAALLTVAVAGPAAPAAAAPVPPFCVDIYLPPWIWWTICYPG